MSDDLVTIEVDGQEIKARNGAMLIEVTDDAGIYVPRFCYHKNLSVAANCRMCLVEVERAPKPLPACATPIMNGMKVFTRSALAVDAQHSTMEFLLINHPLDCPICDQGGECELQDLAMGYGGDVSRYSERKRVVRDKNIGPLVQTDMTRCIHCTRCVRFGEEIAGLRELGATGRSEDMEIGTYVEKAMTSELSGNVIDMCPVGALTSKPYRYSARAWELRQHDSVAPHDCVGSNVHVHVKGLAVKRIVPKDNACVNETWLSDRDRYSYEGLNHAQRLTTPRIKRDGRWQASDWDEALDLVSQSLQAVADVNPRAISALASPSSTTEEFYLLQRLLRALGSHSIDHRLRQVDFADQTGEPLYPGLGIGLDAVESSDAILLLGAYPRHEQPLLNVRIRKAALAGAAVMHVSTLARDFNYDLFAERIVKPSALVPVVAALTRQLAADSGTELEPRAHKLPQAAAPADDVVQVMTKRLMDAERPLILLGATIAHHPLRSTLCQLAQALVRPLDIQVGYLCDGANAAGAWLAGAIPHRGPVGRGVETPGLNISEMLDSPRKAYLLLGLEPDLDCGRARATQDALSRAELVVAMSAFESEALSACADVMLPIAAHGENEGSFVNVAGEWQRFAAAVRPQGEARPAWKILRVLGDRLGLPGFDAVECEQVTGEIEALAGHIAVGGRVTPSLEEPDSDIDPNNLELITEIPMYACDALVRHASALQEMPQSGDDHIRVSPQLAESAGLGAGSEAVVRVNGAELIMGVVIDVAVPEGACAIYAARPATADLAIDGAAVELRGHDGMVTA